MARSSKKTNSEIGGNNPSIVRGLEKYLRRASADEVEAACVHLGKGEVATALAALSARADVLLSDAAHELDALKTARGVS